MWGNGLSEGFICALCKKKIVTRQVLLQRHKVIVKACRNKAARKARSQQPESIAEPVAEQERLVVVDQEHGHGLGISITVRF